MLSIGPYSLRNRVALAPMAGVTDLPFRELAWELGAGLVVTEMVDARPEFWDTELSLLRRAHVAEAEPRSVQIVGADPQMMGEVARMNVAHGAQIIDINFGCPAKQVCKQAAGSALLADPRLVGAIVSAVVAAARVPVTVKMRTGPDPDRRNGVEVARIAAAEGAAALAVHGRTRACRFRGSAEFDTIASIKASVSVPVFANGDIDSAERAVQVVAATGVDGVMIGRAAQGRPWLLGEIAAALAGEVAAPMQVDDVAEVIERHVRRLHEFYGSERGIKIARKHVSWYFDGLSIDPVQRRLFNSLGVDEEQLAFVRTLFKQINKWRQAA